MKRSNLEDFIHKVKERHGDNFTFEKTIYKNSLTDTIITCKIHGDMVVKPKTFIRHGFCKKCDEKAKFDHQFYDFFKKVREKHNGSYYYLKSSFKKLSKKITGYCTIHGKFEQIARDHLHGNGCSRCSGTGKLDTKTFIDRSNKIHNFKYDYSNSVYNKHSSKLTIICPIHGEFRQRANDHMNGKGCINCSLDKRTSKDVKTIIDYLNSVNISFEREKRFDGCCNNRPLPFDFYIEKLNLCIEYDGEQHFKPVEKWGGKDKFEKTKFNDRIKNEYCNNNGIKLLRIRYDDSVIDVLIKELIDLKKEP